MMPVLFANLLWIIACSTYCILCVGQARRDCANGKGFSKRVTKEDLAAEYQS